jgi:hypothetical protein
MAIWRIHVACWVSKVTPAQAHASACAPTPTPTLTNTCAHACSQFPGWGIDTEVFLLRKSVIRPTLYRSQSGVLGIDPQWCHWEFFPRLPTEPCALGSTLPLNMSTRKIPGSKAGRCVGLTTYHLLVPNVKKIRGLNLPDPHGPVAGQLCFAFLHC